MTGDEICVAFGNNEINYSYRWVLFIYSYFILKSILGYLAANVEIASNTDFTLLILT